MRLEDAFSIIVELERRQAPCPVEWQSINMWPLIRQCLWLELLAESPPKTEPQKSRSRTRQSFNIAAKFLSRVVRYLGKQRVSESQRNGIEAVAFISRSAYLQRLPSGELFDRIVDPLIFTSKNRSDIAKYYVTSLPENATLYFPGQCLRSAKQLGQQTIPEDVNVYLDGLANVAGVNASRLRAAYAAAFQTFKGWHQASQSFLAGRTSLKTIYLTSWYFPDMMAITAAARARGITVIDVQHGKQGKYQAMYSGWTRIPEQGYLMMPDRFWCWGQASCDHILAASPGRNVHRPFIGGFPWLDFYRKYVSSASVNRVPDTAPRKRCILVTTQPAQGDNTEPIPDFLIDYMRSDSTGLDHFVFRCHPNDRNGPLYCQRRLASVPSHMYSIDDGKENLYDKLLQSTHHITAYSSCCYEADAFGVPTLLFGQDAKAIYSEEIESGMFAWTSGAVEDIANWLGSDTRRADIQHQQSNAPYIVSSLDQAARILANNAI